MSAERFFRDVISGRRTGLAAACLRGLLRVAEWPYGWAVRWRNAAFDSGRRPAIRVSAKVISVGNLTVGGTGKTPLVAWLARWCQTRGLRVVIISRGYGAERGTANDEARELAQLLPDVPHLQNPDRVAAANEAIQRWGAQVLVLDDALQHRRIHRDLDLVLLDALAPFGYEHLLPRGLLREPLSGLRRAHVVALSRSDLLDPAQRQAIAERVRQEAPNALWLEVEHRPRELIDAEGRRAPVESLAGRRCIAFCGIGNPDGFRGTLAKLGLQVDAWREFPDHCPYDAATLAELERWVATHTADIVLCTGKDLVKIPRTTLGGLPLRALAIELSFAAGADALAARLAEVVVGEGMMDEG